MKLIEIHIHGFGKLYQKTFSFQDGIHILYGPNEAGKSTLHTFIGCMLFGLERRRGRAAQNDLYSRYLPWDHDAAFGGSLTFEYDDESFLLERSFRQGHKSCFLTTPGQGRIACPQELLAERYYDGLTEDLYYNTISIRQAASAAGQSLAGEVQKHLAGVYQTGSDTLDYSRAASWLKSEKKRLESSLDSSPEERYFLLKQQKEHLSAESSRCLIEEKKALEKEMDLCMSALQERAEPDDVSESEEPGSPISSSPSRIPMLLHWIPGLACLILGVALWQNHQNTAAAACAFLSVILFLLLGRRRRSEDSEESDDEETESGIDEESEEDDGSDMEVDLEEDDGSDMDEDLEEDDGSDIDEDLEEDDSSDMDEDFEQLGTANLNDALDPFDDFDRDDAFDDFADSDRDDAYDNFYNSDPDDTFDRGNRSFDRGMNARQLRLHLQTLQKRYQEICRREWESERKAEQARTLEEELEILAAKIEEQKKIRLEVQAVTLALDLLKKAAGQIQNAVGPHLNESMSQILAGLTGGLYRQVYVDDQLCVTVRTGSRTVPLDSLSRGTIEQVHLALRLAVVDLLFPAGGMPLLLDDCFLAYDDERLRQTLCFLAENYSGQVFLFTCQKREAAIFRSERIPFTAVLLPSEASDIPSFSGGKAPHASP